MNKVTIYFTGQSGQHRVATFFTGDPIAKTLDELGGATKSGALYLIPESPGKVLAIPGRNIQEVMAEEVES